MRRLRACSPEPNDALLLRAARADWCPPTVAGDREDWSAQAQAIPFSHHRATGSPAPDAGPYPRRSAPESGWAARPANAAEGNPESAPWRWATVRRPVPGPAPRLLRAGRVRIPRPRPRAARGPQWSRSRPRPGLPRIEAPAVCDQADSRFDCPPLNGSRRAGGPRGSGPGKPAAPGTSAPEPPRRSVHSRPGPARVRPALDRTAAR